ncbi:UNKNOWN [Stylonychia lemnae]|uniref:Transmembrane protein n=1 Tax=Stylonychia lemnae TaxID=5949 RepID=A0A078BBY2_STYLE|nr:UNKNOWN [Stylonychia lemnae]|eukprot:CDW90762.1 UNKNOWN [Stylonychia lemnae]
MPPASMQSVIKKSNQHATMAKNRKLFSNKSEDFYFCIAFIVIVVGIAVVITYSMKNSQERYLKSDYFLQINNIMYGIQKENGTAMLISFKPKFLKKGKTALIQLDDVFDTAKNQSKALNMSYELLKYSKNEAMIQLKLSNQTENDEIFYQNFDKFLKFLKKQKKILNIEYRHFNSTVNPRNKSQYLIAQGTKSKDTLDYRMRFHSGWYTFMEQELKNATAKFTKQEQKIQYQLSIESLGKMCQDFCDIFEVFTYDEYEEDRENQLQTKYYQDQRNQKYEEIDQIQTDIGSSDIENDFENDNDEINQQQQQQPLQVNTDEF